MNHARAPARAAVQTAARTAVLLQGQDHARVPVQTALSGRQDLRDLAVQLAQLVLRGLAALWAQLVLRAPAAQQEQPDLRDLAV